MNFDKFQKLVHDRDGFGVMTAPDAVGDTVKESCSDRSQLYLKIDPASKTITDAKFMTMGCGFAVAVHSLVVRMVRGKSLDAAESVTPEVISEELGGLPPLKQEYAVVGARVLHSALEDYRNKCDGQEGNSVAAFAAPG